MGIIATIIAAVKGQTSYAVCMGIWTAIAFVLAISGYSQFAIGPGVLFLVIAIGKENLRKKGVTKGKSPSIPSSQLNSTTGLTTNNRRFTCEKCGQELSSEWLFCNKCGYPVSRSNDTQNKTTSNSYAYGEPQTESSEFAVIPAITSIDDHEKIAKAEVNKLNIEKLPLKIRRAFRLIEDEEWEKADAYFDKILDSEPENAYAYLGKAFIKAKINSLENITDENIYNICKTRNFARAAKFADGELKLLTSNWESIGNSHENAF